MTRTAQTSTTQPSTAKTKTVETGFQTGAAEAGAVRDSAAETVVVLAEVTRRAGARRLDATAAFGGTGLFGGTGELAGRDTVQLWPHRHGTDAMFCAQLSRGA